MFVDFPARMTALRQERIAKSKDSGAFSGFGYNRVALSTDQNNRNVIKPDSRASGRNS